MTIRKEEEEEQQFETYLQFDDSAIQIVEKDQEKNTVAFTSYEMSYLFDAMILEIIENGKYNIDYCYNESALFRLYLSYCGCRTQNPDDMFTFYRYLCYVISDHNDLKQYVRAEDIVIHLYDRVEYGLYKTTDTTHIKATINEFNNVKCYNNCYAYGIQIRSRGLYIYVHRG
jgi:hypothetical protein